MRLSDPRDAGEGPVEHPQGRAGKQSGGVLQASRGYAQGDGMAKEITKFVF